MLLARIIRSRPGLFTGLGAGLVAWLCLPATLRTDTRGILAWDAGVFVFLVLAVRLFATARPERMAANAEAQEEGEWTIFVVTLGVIIASFAVMGSEFSAIKSAPDAARTWHILLVAVTQFLSWLMNHVTFAFRYAHEYYQDDGKGGFERGLEFPATPEPDYMDFAYFALVLGMTFQVSDVQITSRKLRRVALLHGLLSFLFNATIIALTVNLAAGLMG